MIAAIEAESIGLGMHVCALHLHPYYRHHFGFQRGLCPVAEAASDRLFSLPLYSDLTHNNDVRCTVTAVATVLAAAPGAS